MKALLPPCEIETVTTSHLLLGRVIDAGQSYEPADVPSILLQDHVIPAAIQSQHSEGGGWMVSVRLRDM